MLSWRLLSLKVLLCPACQMLPIGQPQSRGLNAASSLPKRVGLCACLIFACCLHLRVTIRYLPAWLLSSWRLYLELLARVLAVREQSLVRSKNRYIEVFVMYRLFLVKTSSADLAFIAVHLPSVLTCVKDVAPVMLARISTIWPILNARVHSLGPKCRPAQPMGLKIPRVLYKV